MKILRIGLALAFFASAPAMPEVVVGIVTDGPVQRYVLSPELLEREVTALMGREFDVTFPDAKQVDGGWTLDGVRSALARQLADSQVDVIVTLGVVASNEVVRIPNLSKPVIAPVVVDRELQGFPLDGRSSGKPNLVYLSNFFSLGEELRSFKTVGRFSNLTILADPLVTGSMPQLAPRARALAADLGITLTVVPVTDSVADTLAALPAETDAVYLAPLLRLTLDDIGALAGGLIQRELISMSLVGRDEVERGILMTNHPEEDDTRVARRIALNLQRILLGENAADIEVGIPRRQRLTINMRTARALKFSPRFAVLADADKLFEEEDEAGEKLTMLGAIQEALQSNPDLQAVLASVDIAAEDVRNARAPLLPRLDLTAATTEIDADGARTGFAAERSTDAKVVVSQLVYSEQVKAGFDIARYLKASADENYQVQLLDTVRASAAAYLNVLRAKALEEVRASNVDVTRTNLDLARVREAIGISGRSDVLRWESQIAVDRQELLAATADRRQSETELNRVLHRPQSAPVLTMESGIDKPLRIVSDPRFERFIDNPIAWETFQEFSIQEALENSPEIKSIDATINAQARVVTAARRSYFVPDVSVAGSGSRNIDRSGVGSDFESVGIDDTDWAVSIQATIPIYAGGGRKAELSQSRFELRQLELQRASLSDSVSARVLAAMQQAGGSHPAIELSQAAADAAKSNLELVTDQYSKGVVSVTDLIDAQDAALAAKLAAAEAVYAFLIDYVDVLRASGDFGLLTDPAGAGPWLDKVESYFRERGIEP